MDDKIEDLVIRASNHKRIMGIDWQHTEKTSRLFSKTGNALQEKQGNAPVIGKMV